MPPEGFDRALGASYRLDERIGSGATGEVWRGVDRRTDESIAAKLLHREHLEDDTLVERFVRERSILSGLRHPNVVAVRDLVVEGDRLAIVMEFVGGGSLRDTLRDRGPLPPAVALRVVAAVLDGLAAAHERRIRHRDVKPDNVLLATAWPYLGPGAVKLSDFGIAEIVAANTNGSSGLVGTPEYMAPEHLVTGAGTFPGDVYAAGILLYELLAGRTPFAGPQTGYVIARRHVTNEVPRLPLPDPIWAELTPLLAKDPDRRPTARAAAEALGALAASVGDLAALPAQDGPEDFTPAGRPATEIRGLVVPAGRSTSAPAETESSPRPPTEPAPDLGSGQPTMLRSMPVLPSETVARPSPTTPATSSLPAWWRSRRSKALVGVGALLVALGIGWIILAATDRPAVAPPTDVVVKAQQQSPALPSGLAISRTATWDPAQGTATVSITYSTQAAALTGPFLEVVPGPAESAQACPPVQWRGASARPNVASVTGLDTACAWGVEARQIKARSSATITAELPLALPADDPASALQAWLDSAASATADTTADGQVTSTAYAAQRLTDIQVVGPSRTVSGKTLRLSLVPVYPNGADPLHPLFRSPPSGAPTETLVAVAGGTAGVRFSDGCNGGLAISGDGLVVRTQSVAQECQVVARVGNFTDLTSSPFEITTRGS